MERVNSRNGIHTIEAAADLGMGSREYELIEIKQTAQNAAEPGILRIPGSKCFTGYS